MKEQTFNEIKKTLAKFKTKKRAYLSVCINTNTNTQKLDLEKRERVCVCVFICV